MSVSKYASLLVMLFSAHIAGCDTSNKVNCPEGQKLCNGKCISSSLECKKGGLCTSSTCNSHGSCDDTSGGVVCHCDLGWAPPNCGSCAAGYAPSGGRCVQEATCGADSCSQHGVCTDTSGSVTCSCDVGWALPNCADCAGGYHREGDNCVLDQGCSSNTCSGHGQCTDTATGFTCDCDTGWAGTSCSRCDDGYHPEGDTCAVNVACATDSCSGHGSCDDSSGLPECNCDVGWAAPVCDSCAVGYHEEGNTCVLDNVVADVTFSIDSSANNRPISPYIYGTNQTDWQGAGAYLKMGRAGGNRWTAYNWETNASNAGSDWYYSSDSYLGGGETPGEAVRSRVQAAKDANAAFLITVPIAGYVAADKDGSVDLSDPNHLSQRFFESPASKGSAFVLSPDLNDSHVYQDEFVNWVVNSFPPGSSSQPIFYSLDNEPDLWAHTHEQIHPDPPTYVEMVERTTAYATAIKAVDPQATVFGFVSYGWAGFETLQDAPDSGANGNFIDYFLTAMNQAEAAAGQRLMDVLDVHWYPEAQGGGQRIINDGNGPQIVAARLQAARSLWDPTYTEDSWIAQWSTTGPITLLPRLKEQINTHYPGTLLAITEYNYGGYGHISGGIAQADVLGVYGEQGVFAACLWEMGGDHSFHYGGFNMYLNYDGSGGQFGDTSIMATSSDIESSAVYASTFSADPNKMVIVAINKTNGNLNAQIAIEHNVDFSSGQIFRLTQSSATPQAAGTVTPAGNSFTATLPPMSVSTIVLGG